VLKKKQEGTMKKGAASNAWKGAFLSGAVFPGLGQLALRRYGRGIVLMLTTLASLAVLVVIAVQRALAILEEIASEGGAMDMSTILSAATQASTSSDSVLFTVVLLFLILCWIVGVVDAYRIGKKMDSGESSANRGSISKSR